jgi:hypothetical protein
MNVVVLVPSRASLESAGVRIRYMRLRDRLAEAGVSLLVTHFDAFDPLKADCDAVIISKCYDARALVAAALLSRRKINVGLDLFDDYFSDERDSRLSRYRTWLRQMLQICRFAICSTPSMARIVEGYCADLPVHILSDPAPQIVGSDLIDLLQRKIARAKSSDVLRISWFGIGDNPFFPVGISDVAAFGGPLRELTLDGLPIELTILTNKRALDAQGLALIGQLPVPAKIELWSEQRESELLRQTDVCFLPVSAQPFSTSKSLNRALTALSSGCQVLSVGYPLYQPLDELIYREPAALLEDWRRGEPRLRPSSLVKLENKIAQLASPAREAAKLADFLQRIIVVPAWQAAPGPIAVLHGFATTETAHAAVKAAGGLSIASPFCAQELQFDAIARMGPAGEPSLLVSTDVLPRLKSTVKRRREPMQRIGGRKFVQIAAVRSDEERDTNVTGALPVQIALYGRVIEGVSTLISGSFGAAPIILSEESALPIEPSI